MVAAASSSSVSSGSGAFSKMILLSIAGYIGVIRVTWLAVKSISLKSKIRYGLSCKGK